ncbi:hypothetical protein [Flexibacterium corallicola]|uniref:hypothetical protein n=1 Tax=Flexibacterium corallicola TaxID=3037259 RepID=UPI00286F3331|nr:hypothetical protein [Pseudovibrio sp. M1P-2-3]
MLETQKQSLSKDLRLVNAALNDMIIDTNILGISLVSVASPYSEVFETYQDEEWEDLGILDNGRETIVLAVGNDLKSKKVDHSQVTKLCARSIAHALYKYSDYRPYGLGALYREVFLFTVEAITFSAYHQEADENKLYLYSLIEEFIKTRLSNYQTHTGDVKVLLSNIADVVAESNGMFIQGDVSAMDILSLSHLVIEEEVFSLNHTVFATL